MKVLIFGGSFDPPHLGHKALFKAAREQLRPDKSYVVPTSQNPLKTAARTTLKQRRRLIRAAMPKARDFKLPDTGARDRTWMLLRKVRRAHPKAELYFLIGSDSLAGFSRWVRPKDILDSATLLVGRRPRHPAKVPAWTRRRVRFLQGAFPDVSATAIRERLMLGESLEGLVAREVEALVHEMRLYGLEHHAWLAANLKAGRYRHSIEVARLAGDLAVRHGIDPDKARLAGILHDAGKSLDKKGLKRYVRKRGLAVPAREAIIANAPMLLHAYVSADIALRRFHVSEREVLSGIRKHTLGALDMSDFDKLMYVADAASYDRKHKEAAAIRAAAIRDLDRGWKRAFKIKLFYAKKHEKWLHPLATRIEARLKTS